MKGKKILFLALALLLPVAVFVFLKIFGRNEFNVPALHQDGAIDAPRECDFTYTTPYRVPDSIMVSMRMNSNDSLYVLFFDAAPGNAMERISVEFAGDPVRNIAPSAFAGQRDLKWWKECVLLMEPPASIALVDQERRIRGYYDGKDRDEVDRLIVEMKIILKKY